MITPISLSSTSRRPVRATITLYPIGRPVRATITLYPIRRPVRATITLYPKYRETCRATITLYPIGRLVRAMLSYKENCDIYRELLLQEVVDSSRTAVSITTLLIKNKLFMQNLHQ